MDEQTPQDQLRVGDADRERVAERLRSAYAEGRLDLAEYDDRVRQAWAARTYGELDRLTGDLPAGGTEPAGRRPPAPLQDSGAGGVARGRDERRQHGPHRASVAAWLSVSLINVVIWATVSLSTLHWVYPWWIWIAGPWGAVILAGWITGRSGGARPSR